MEFSVSHKHIVGPNLIQLTDAGIFPKDDMKEGQFLSAHKNNSMCILGPTPQLSCPDAM